MNDEPQTGELTADELKELEAETIRRDRITLFKELNDLTDELVPLVSELPYRLAKPALDKIEAIMAAVCDPLGEHFGECELCEEPMFVMGNAGDDVCSASEDGGWAHRSCIDALQKSNPELFRSADDDED